MREREAFFKKECQRKDADYQALMDLQVEGIEVNQGLRAELNQLRDELAARDKFIDNLESEIKRKDGAIQNLAALDQKSGIGNRESALTKLLKEWQKQSKATRDWTKANLLLGELEKLINPPI